MGFGSIDYDHIQMVEYNLCGGFGFQKHKLCVDIMKTLCFIIVLRYIFWNVNITEIIFTCSIETKRKINMAMMREHKVPKMGTKM
jgi:hypothetical protein